MRKLREIYREHCLKAVAHDNRTLPLTHPLRRDGALAPIPCTDGTPVCIRWNTRATLLEIGSQIAGSGFVIQHFKDRQPFLQVQYFRAAGAIEPLTDPIALPLIHDVTERRAERLTPMVERGPHKRGEST